MVFSEIVYRGYGPHQRKGGGFSTLGVTSQEEMDQALASGWYRTLPEAIEAQDAKKAIVVPHVSAPATVIAPVKDVIEVPADNAPPTRGELEQKATELGIKFDGRTSDKKLGDKIAEKLKA